MAVGEAGVTAANSGSHQLSLEERSGEVTIRYDKGGVYRTVPLTAVVRKAVRDYLETQPELKSDDLLWVGERGVLTDQGSVLYLLKKYAFQARLDERLISPHVPYAHFGGLPVKVMGQSHLHRCRIIPTGSHQKRGPMKRYKRYHYLWIVINFFRPSNHIPGFVT